MIRPRHIRKLHTLSKSIVISDPVRHALANGEPIVALESTIITHGMPAPHNLNTAKNVEEIIRQKGALPATIAMLDGKIHVGLETGMLEALANDKKCIKISRRDFPYALAKNMSGGTTVAGTMMIAHRAGIPIFVTGGIGGVHRQGENTLDISADLTELGRTPVAVVCAGVKSILDIGRTLEYLETQGVCVATLSDNEKAPFPSFFSAESAFPSPMTLKTTNEAAEVIKANLEINESNGVLLAVPIPLAHSIDNSLIDSVIEAGLEECDAHGIKGKAITPFILSRVNEMTKGKSLAVNQVLIENNASVGGQVAVDLASSLNKSSSLHHLKSSSGRRRPVVIGGSNFDVICRVNEALETNASSTLHAKIRTCFGGVGRSLAQALARLDCNPLFISAVGDDHLGRCILAENSLLDTSHIRMVKGQATATYALTLTAQGDLWHGLGDMEVHASVTPDSIKECQRLIQAASMVALDANFSQETVDCVLRLCLEHRVPVFFEPTDPRKGLKGIVSPWKAAITYTSPNVHELRMMVAAAGNANDESIDAISDDQDTLLRECNELGRALLSQMPGAAGLIITLGHHGVLFMEPSEKSRHYAVQPEANVVSVSGAGDCLSAAFMAGLLHGYDAHTAILMGLNAASLSLRHVEAVPDSLSMQFTLSSSRSSKKI